MKRYDSCGRLIIAIAIIAAVVVVVFAGCVEEETPATALSPTEISIPKTTPTPEAPTAPATVKTTAALASISEDDLSTARDHYLHHDYCRHMCNGNKALYDECMEYYESRNHSR
jgi:hypothetical protein